MASSLVPKCAAGYREGAMVTLRVSRTLALAGAAVVTLALAATFTALEADRIYRTWRATASADAHVTSDAFTEAAATWLRREQHDTIRRVAEVMATGEFRAVEVVLDGESIVSAGVQAEMNDSPNPGAVGARSSIERHGARWILQTSIPVPSAVGVVRTQQDVSVSHAALVHAIVRIGALGLGSWIALTALAWSVGRGWIRRRKVLGHAGAPTAASHQVEHASILAIDRRTKATRINDVSVRLSPKQFALLSLLASDEGKVFSEADILLAVWPNSKYADANDVRQCIYQLRRRLDAAAAGGAQHVRNVKGFGYGFVSAVPAPNAGAEAEVPAREEPSHALYEQT